ncbi:MAG: septum site-determining protein MinC, partial [Gammaproteobacteria bacterium]
MTDTRAAKPALEFKGRMTTLTTLRLLNPSVEVLARELDKRLREAPALFRRLPVVVDIGEIADSDLYLDLPGFIELLRTRELLPIGIRGGDER